MFSNPRAAPAPGEAPNRPRCYSPSRSYRRSSAYLRRSACAEREERGAMRVLNEKIREASWQEGGARCSPLLDRRDALLLLDALLDTLDGVGGFDVDLNLLARQGLHLDLRRKREGVLSVLGTGGRGTLLGGRTIILADWVSGGCRRSRVYRGGSARLRSPLTGAVARLRAQCSSVC